MIYKYHVLQIAWNVTYIHTNFCTKLPYNKKPLFYSTLRELNNSIQNKVCGIELKNGTIFDFGRYLIISSQKNCNQAPKWRLAFKMISIIQIKTKTKTVKVLRLFFYALTFYYRSLGDYARHCNLVWANYRMPKLLIMGHKAPKACSDHTLLIFKQKGNSLSKSK